MITAMSANGQHQANGAKSNFDIYREGGTTRDIRVTVNLVLVARR